MPVIASLFLCLSPVAVDGDTLRCANVPEANGRVRLARIDTPERGEPGFEEAKAALAALIADEGRGAVRCEWIDADPRTRAIERHDRYGRRVARCSVEGRDLGAAMLRGGWAREWPGAR